MAGYPCGFASAFTLGGAEADGHLQVISVLIPFFRLGFCSTSLIFMLAYVWSKNFATQNVSLYGLLTVQVSSAGPADLNRCLASVCPVQQLHSTIILT